MRNSHIFIEYSQVVEIWVKHKYIAYIVIGSSSINHHIELVFLHKTRICCFCFSIYIIFHYYNILLRLIFQLSTGIEAIFQVFDFTTQCFGSLQMKKNISF